MKIALVTKGLFPFTVGGIERHSTLLATHLAHLGAEVTVLTPEPEASSAKDMPFEIISLPLPPPTRHWLHTQRAASAATKVIESRDFDVVYGQGHTCAHYIMRERRLPLIWSPHGMELFHAIGAKHKLQNLPYRHRFTRLAKRAERVVCLGGKLNDILTEKLKIEQRRIVVIPNAVDPELVRSRLDATVKRDPRELLFIGRLHSNKGADVLIETFNRLLDVDVGVTLAGDGPLASTLKARNKNPRVKFAGSVTDQELFRLLSASGALVLPSLFEGMPTVILEAMAAKLPIVSTDIGAVRTMVIPGKTGFIVQPGSSDTLRPGILDYLALSDAEKASYGAEGEKHVLANFTWPIVAKKTLELAEELKQLGRR